MPAENGLPQYVSRHARTKLYQYYRRPSKGVSGSAFVRSFGTKDRRSMMQQYPAVHGDAETYFARLISGRTLNLDQVEAIARGVALVSFEASKDRGAINTYDLRSDIAARASDLPGAGPADLEAIYQSAVILRQQHVADFIDQGLKALKQDQVKLRAVAPQTLSKAAFTLRDAYEQAWKPSKERGKNTVVEIGRYVDEFETLNGKLDLQDYTREHWGAWRKDCLDRHGPGPTAFKRFSMMKTIVNESIRAGLFERKNFNGQDVTMKKPKARKLRNEGWLQEELTTWFGAPLFRGSKDSPRPDADYWIAVIIALTGARLSEVVGMKVPDVAERHGMKTFYFAREHGKTEDSRRIIPIPQRIIDLGFMDYLKTRPKAGALFEKVSSKLMSQTYGRMRVDLDLNRRGCDIHAFRHHMKTLLSDLKCPDRVSDYITGHAPPNVGATYGKTLFTSCLEYLDQIDLGIVIPKWKA